MTRFYAFYRLLTAAIFFILASQNVFANKIVELSVKGGIGPATADYLQRGIAKGQDASLIIIQLDTPGGLDKSMRHIVQSILTSKIPIVIYVAPNGARAASAGTFLLYASTVAAMAPSTHLGAASPISLTGGLGSNSKGGKKKSTLGKKVTNDAVAYIRTLAQLRNRNVDFAQKAVTDAATMTAKEAKKAGVIDIIAKNQDDLLKQLDGLTVEQSGQKIKLVTKNAQIEKVEPDWRMRFLLVITDPTVAYLLLLLGVYGIFFELVNPGFVLPGVVGVIAMLIALYALQLLPINYAGLGLIVFGVIFIIGEAFIPSFGALGLGGTIAFIIGSILLIDTEHASYQIAWSAIWAMAAVNVLFFVALLGMAVKSRRKKVLHGVGVLIGAEGRAITAIEPRGQAVIRGEIWNVHAKQAIAPNKPIIVVAVEGLQLEVEEINTR